MRGKSDKKKNSGEQWNLLTAKKGEKDNMLPP